MLRQSVCIYSPAR